MKQLIILLGILLQSAFGYAQVSNKSNIYNFVWPYELPAHMDRGPMDVNVKGQYYFTRETLGDRSFVRLHFDVTSLEFMPKVYSTLRYKYQGKIYRADQVAATDGLGIADFENVSITSVRIEIGVNFLQNPKKGFIGSEYAAYDVGDIAKDADLNTLTLNIGGSVLRDLNWVNSTALESRLLKIERLVQNRADYQNVIRDADNAFKAKNWQEAKRLYQKAASLLPDESYPDQQMDKVDEAIAETNKPKENPSTAAASDSGQPQSASSKTDDDYWGNNLGKNSTGKDSTKPDSGGSLILSEKVKVNGEYVQVFKQDGKHYMVRSDGSTHETTEQAYTAVQNVSSKQNPQAAAAAKTDSYTMDDYNKAVAANQASLNKQYAKIQADSEKLQTKLNAGIQSFYAAQKASGAKASLKENSVLTGDYNSVEELETAFQQQIDAINYDIQTLEAATNQQIESSYNALFSDSSAETQAYGQVAAGIAGIIGENSAEKKKQQAMAELEASKKAQLKRIEDKKIAMRKDMRMALLAEFPQGGVPLSSHKVYADELYFFVYSYDTATLADAGAAIVVSEIFPLARYGDGTWPFMNSIMNEIKALKDVKSMQLKGPLTLVGYYATRTLAEETHASFLRLAQSSQLTVQRFTYKGKPFKGGGAATDFWGNETKSAAAGKPAETPGGEVTKTSPAPEGGVDFWGNPVKKETQPTAAENPPAAAPATSSSSSSSSSATDYWGNPVKKDK